MASDLEKLNATFGRPGSVSFIDHKLGGIAAELVTEKSSAQVALHGAHVLSFTPQGAKDVLWMSPEARIAEGQGIRGGIPVCWPWFATHATDPSKPDHGFVRKRPWRVARTEASAGRAVIELAHGTKEGDEALWPGRAELTLTVSLTDRLQVDLTTRNIGAEAFELTQALHTYFAVGEIAQTVVDGLDGRAYLDKLQANKRLKQSGGITFDGEVDRIYLDTVDDVTIEDQGNKRAIRVAKSGSRSTVVWNPAVEKSLRLSHMPPGAYRGMVCVETTNAGGDVITLQPRDEHRLSTILSVEPLASRA